MSDRNQWASPSGDQNVPDQQGQTPPPAAPPAPTGTAPGTAPLNPPHNVPPGGGWTSPPPGGVPGGAPGGVPGGAPGNAPGAPRPSGWTPPPKPGLVPLQPMTLGTILAGSFQVMRRNPRPTFGVSLIINGIVAVVSIAAVVLSSWLGFDRLATASTANVDEISAGSTALTALSSLVTAGVGLVGTAILQGIISLEVSRGTVGEKLTAGQLWQRAKGRIGVLIGWSLLIALAVIVFLGVLIALVAILIVTMGNAGIVIGVLLALAGFAGGVVLFAWIGTRVSLVPSALLIERLKLSQAVRRSWNLTVGYFWRTLGIQLLVAVIVSVAAQIVLLPVSFGIGIFAALSNPNGDLEALDSLFLTTIIITTVLSALIGAVTAIISSATSALIYVDLRIRKEGLDLALIRFVEARQGGDESLPDPYRATVASTEPSSTA